MNKYLWPIYCFWWHHGGYCQQQKWNLKTVLSPQRAHSWTRDTRCNDIVRDLAKQVHLRCAITYTLPIINPLNDRDCWLFSKTAALPFRYKHRTPTGCGHTHGWVSLPRADITQPGSPTVVTASMHTRMESREAVLMTLFAGQEWRRRHRGRTWTQQGKERAGQTKRVAQTCTHCC